MNWSVTPEFMLTQILSFLNQLRADVHTSYRVLSLFVNMFPENMVFVERSYQFRKIDNNKILLSK